jgi:hypothetical protein
MVCLFLFLEGQSTFPRLEKHGAATALVDLDEHEHVSIHHHLAS